MRVSSLIIIVAVSMGNMAFGSQFTDDLLRAIMMVESGGRDVVGDSGRAVGPFQIWRSYWKDAVGAKDSIAKDISYQDCHKTAESRLVVLAYFNRYEPQAVKRHDRRTLFMLHHYGPNWRARNGDPHGYVAKCERFFK